MNVRRVYEPCFAQTVERGVMAVTLLSPKAEVAEMNDMTEFDRGKS
jgi:hypothetical protein